MIFLGPTGQQISFSCDSIQQNHIKLDMLSSCNEQFRSETGSFYTLEENVALRSGCADAQIDLELHCLHMTYNSAG